MAGWCISPQQAADLRAAGRCYMKLLVSNKAVGVLIGKAGASLKELISTSNCTFKFSAADQAYPGTLNGERVVVLAGTEEAIAAGIDAILNACIESGKISGASEPSLTSLQIAIPSSSCGAVIGKGGETLKSIREKSGASIVMAGREESAVSTERLCTLTGNAKASLGEAMRAISDLISQDEARGQFLETPSQGKGPQGSGASAYRGAAAAAVQVSEHRNCTIHFEISDAEAAVVIGKGGKMLQSIILQTSTKIKVSSRAEGETTSNREVTITGPMHSVHAAHAMILEQASKAN
eukprot:TRINITY_DN15042_c0_g1_i1.p1 TRINITY_DN15042_c0_g1~~TRINITY_DN15042_c0_g1_i1.p1  ORF type:complete len:294 (-),score=55.18 TRINITY_DN15042_c0_g1_i1:349-1230(-)